MTFLLGNPGRQRCSTVVWATAVVLAWAGDLAAQVQPQTGDPLPGLTTGQLNRFFAGRDAFNRSFAEADGLGPIFNKESCASCHQVPTVGGTGSVTVTRAGQTGKGGFDPLEHLGGSLFQREAISEECREQVSALANTEAHRVTNGIMGYGLIEAIADGDIAFYELNPPSAEVSGRVHWVPAVEDDPPGQLHAGRFGWKAQEATMMSFSADALLNEIGVTNLFFLEENDPNGINPPELADCDSVADPEADLAFLQELTDFQRLLAFPPQTPQSGMAGETWLAQIGCFDCHIPSFMTADDPRLEDAIRNKQVRPYSDLLLHDMGVAADFIEQGDAAASELRTAPLGGLRTRDPMWHDGRVAAGTFADRIMAAVACHCAIGSEAKASAERFLSGTSATCPDSVTVPGSGFVCDPGTVPNGLNDQQRAEAISFLNSLGRLEFDEDGDQDVQVDDFFGLLNCSFLDLIGPDDPCAVHDVDQNGIVDQTDFDLFMTVYVGPRTDCDCNGVVDLEDIFSGASDSNADGIPDLCDPFCAADTDCSGAVGVSDVLILIATWGACPGGSMPCAADLDHDGLVDITDFLGLLAAWGACGQ